jgi:two-component system CheB/CheR fusion protein
MKKNSPIADEQPVSKEENTPSHIVGIGASAGGLEAIEAFFKAMPSDSGVAFVVVQHLSPDHKSLMVELLSKHTDMSVRRVEDGMTVERDCVYLIPPNANLRLFHGNLLLSEQNRDQRGINLPIDVFLRSLAEDQGDKAIAIILSGTGSDGTSGIRAIKEELGMVMVQSEESAAFDGMPRSAVATGLVDFILAPEDMPNQLLSYLKHPFASQDDITGNLLSDDDGLTRIFALLREHNKIDFTFYKPSTIIRRIERRMAVKQIHQLNDYVRYLESYPVEVNSLYKDLLIGVTSFFRDPSAFHALSKHLPELLRNAKEESLRLWVAGCSTGEEAYTLAILCREIMEQEDLHLDIKIFATDIDQDATMQASSGIFAESSVAEIDPNLISKYFYHQEENFQISRQIREMVVFAQHNLIKDPPFTNIDLISCRNLLIYLQPILQQRVLELFNFALNPKGILLLGSSETTGEMAEYFEPLDHKWRIYNSRGRRRHADLSTPAATFDPSRWRTNHHPMGRHTVLRAHEEERMLDRLLQSVSGDYLPFCMIISEDLELMHVVGEAGTYLRFPTGKLINDVSKLANKDLAIPLTTGIQKVAKSKEELLYSNIHLRDGNSSHTVNMRLKPLPGKKGQPRLVGAFIEELRRDSDEEESPIESYDVGREAEQRIADLENELQFTRENLQATVEELETSNEELQATNEELLASNEELQSTNEELQSVNEELYTVNSEYQGKIIELTEANNDLDNLLQNIRVATLFVDESLDIRRFTLAATELLQLMEQDIGRPLNHVAHRMGDLDLFGLASHVQRSNKLLEQDVTTEDGRNYLLRIRPYQISPNHYSGVVLTFFDINDLRQAEGELHERDVRMKALLNTIPDGYILINPQGIIQEVNHTVQQLLGYGEEELLGQQVELLMPKESAEHHQDYIDRYLNGNDPTIIGRPRELQARHKDGSPVPILLTLSEARDGGNRWFVALIHAMEAEKES